MDWFHFDILTDCRWRTFWQYYLDVSVLVGQDNSNARIPIRII